MAIPSDNNPFVYHMPTPEQVRSIQHVRDILKLAYDHLMSECPPSRERALAVTKLEECSMWANKSVVFN